MYFGDLLSPDEFKLSHVFCLSDLLGQPVTLRSSDRCERPRSEDFYTTHFPAVCCLSVSGWSYEDGKKVRLELELKGFSVRPCI
jgi:hypothetical protein